MGGDFASARVGCSLSLSNCPDTCDSLHDVNLVSDVVSIAAMHFFNYLMLHIYFSGTPFRYGHMADILSIGYCANSRLYAVL